MTCNCVQVSERVSEWASEWVSVCVCVWLYFSGTEVRRVHLAMEIKTMYSTTYLVC